MQSNVYLYQAGNKRNSLPSSEGKSDCGVLSITLTMEG